MTRDEVLATIEAAYAARVAGDADVVARFWSEDATFEIAGEASLLSNFPGSTGPEDGEPAVAALMRLVAMDNVRLLDAVVEGDRAVTFSRVSVSFAGRTPFETTICDVWEFDAAGKVRSLIEYIDTARIAVELHAMVQ